ncbi:MAG: hypothetical protein IJ975_03580, partial [Clostridia bacterium]|nr:hypothetical protein [Clostridia bacterium]
MSEMKVRKRAKISSILKFVLIAILGFALLGVGIHTTASYSKTTEISVAIMSTDNGTYYNAANGGRVLVNGASVGHNGAQILRVGQQTTLKAKANEGYTFVGFFTDITQLEKLSGSAEYSFVADEDVSRIYASFAKNYEISFEIADPFNDGQTLSFTETLYVGQEVAVSDIIANNESLGENAEEIAAYYENSTPKGEGNIGGFSFAKNKIIVGTQATNITIQPTEPTQVGWAGGTGTKDDPYIINTPALLNTLSSDVNAGTIHSGEYFSITAPITVSAFTPIGGANYAFEGILRGNDYTITISSLASATLNYAGLFGWNAGTIDGLNVAASATITGGSYVGTIAGYNTGTISYCESTAAVSGS